MIPRATFGIAGPMAAGKGTLLRILGILLGKELMANVSTGMVLENIARAEGISNPTDVRVKQNLFSEKAKTLGEQWLLPEIQKYWEASQKPYRIFDGVRMPWDVAFVLAFSNSSILFVTADIHTRFRRAKIRTKMGGEGAKGDELIMTFEEFGRRHAHATAKFISEIERIPGVTVLQNNSPRAFGAATIAFLLNRGITTPAEVETKRSELEALYQELEELEKLQKQEPE